MPCDTAVVRWGFTSTGRNEGEEEAAAVHRRVQGRSGEAARGEREGPAAGGRRARGPSQPAEGLAERAARGRLGRGPGAAEGRGGRAGAAAAREQTAPGGGRGPEAGGGFFCPGGGGPGGEPVFAPRGAALSLRLPC